MQTMRDALTCVNFISGSANQTYTDNFASVYGLRVCNDGAAALTVTINGMTLTVAPNSVMDERFLPTKTFSIAATTAWRCFVRGC